MSNNEICSLEIHGCDQALNFCNFEHEIVQISSDEICTVFVTKGGDLYQIGSIPGYKKSVAKPRKIDISDVAYAKVGFDRLVIIMADGSLMGCGFSEYFSLGLDEKEYVTKLTPIPSENYKSEKILFVSNLYSASIALSNSNLFVFGQT